VPVGKMELVQDPERIWNCFSATCLDGAHPLSTCWLIVSTLYIIFVYLFIFETQDGRTFLLKL